MSNDDAPKDGEPTTSFRTRRRTRKGKRRSLRVPVDEVPRRSAADDVTTPTSEAPMPLHSRPPDEPDVEARAGSSSAPPMDADTVPGSVPAPEPASAAGSEPPASEPPDSEPPASEPPVSEVPDPSDVPKAPPVPTDVEVPEPEPLREPPPEAEPRATTSSTAPQRDSVVVRGTVRVSDHPSAMPSAPPRSAPPSEPPGETVSSEPPSPSEPPSGASPSEPAPSASPSEPAPAPAAASADPTQEIELPDDVSGLADFDSEPPAGGPEEAAAAAQEHVPVELDTSELDEAEEEPEEELDIELEEDEEDEEDEAEEQASAAEAEPDADARRRREDDTVPIETQGDREDEGEDDGAAEITIEEASPEEMAAELGLTEEELELDFDSGEYEGAEPAEEEEPLDDAEELDLEQDAEELDPAAAKPPSYPPPTPPEASTEAAEAEGTELGQEEVLEAEPEPAEPPPPPQETAQPEAQPPEPRPRRRRKPWWEDFFNDDYLRTVRPYPEKYIARQCDFIEQALGLEKGATILDVGCGLGLHAVELAARGYLVVGLDLSLPMLSRAADEAQDQGLKINFLHADMREMTFDGAFDAVLCWGTTLGYFDEETNRKVIERLYRALKPMGLLLIDVVNRDHVIRSQPNLVWFEGDGCVCMEETQFNYITSRLEVKRTVILDDGRQRENLYTIRLYSLNELGRILHDQGFRVAAVSGHEAHPRVFFGADSPRMIITAERRLSKGTKETPKAGKGADKPPPPPSEAKGGEAKPESGETEIEEIDPEVLEERESVIPTLTDSDVEPVEAEEVPGEDEAAGETGEPAGDSEPAPPPDGDASDDDASDDEQR